MNNNGRKSKENLLGYQAGKLQSLMTEMVECCQDKNLYETQKFGIPYAEINCLMLFKGERYLTVKNIAEKLDVAKSRVTILVEGLITKGFLESIHDPKDGRIKLVSTTQKGKNKLEDIDSFHRNIHKKIISQFELHERKNVLSFLERLRSAMETVKETFV